MCEALRELMKDEIEQDVARGEARGEMRGKAEGIVEMGYEFGLSESANFGTVAEKTKYIITDCTGISQNFWKTSGISLENILKKQSITF